MDFDFDFFVIGAGSGGVRASRRAAAAGARVAVAEDSRLGGTCVNLGCIPKKLLSYAAHYGEDFVDAAGFGWTVGERRFDWPSLIANKDREISRLNGVYERLLQSKAVVVVDTGQGGAEAAFEQDGAAVGALDDADGGPLLWELHVPVVEVDVHLHLAEILVGELPDLQVHEDEPAQELVVEHEVDKEVLVVEGEAALAPFEQEALPKLQREVLQLVDDAALQLGVGGAGALVHPQEFEDERLLEQVGGLLDHLPHGRQRADGLLVAGEREALVQAAVELAA